MKKNDTKKMIIDSWQARDQQARAMMQRWTRTARVMSVAISTLMTISQNHLPDSGLHNVKLSGGMLPDWDGLRHDGDPLPDSLATTEDPPLLKYYTVNKEEFYTMIGRQMVTPDNITKVIEPHHRGAAPTGHHHLKENLQEMWLHWRYKKMAEEKNGKTHMVENLWPPDIHR